MRELSLAFLGSEVAGSDELGALRFQLLSGLAGLMADAYAIGAPTAVFLVHEFLTGDTDLEKQQMNDADYAAFLEAVAPDASRHETDDGWWADPAPVRGANALMAASTQVVFAKLRTATDPDRRIGG